MTTTDPFTPPRHDIPNEALADELAVLRAQRARPLAYLYEQRCGGATVVRIERVAPMLGGAAWSEQEMTTAGLALAPHVGDGDAAVGRTVISTSRGVAPKCPDTGSDPDARSHDPDRAGALWRRARRV